MAKFGGGTFFKENFAINRKQEKIQKMRSFFKQIIQDITHNDNELFKNVLNRRKQNLETTKLREQILIRARQEIWEFSRRNSLQWDVAFNKKSPGIKWEPVSYVSIAYILGGDHSTWVKMARKLQNV